MSPAGYSYLSARYNMTEWWPVVRGARARVAKSATASAVVHGVRADVALVYARREWWLVFQPFADSLVVPLALTAMGADGDEGGCGDGRCGKGLLSLALAVKDTLLMLAPTAGAFTSWITWSVTKLLSGALVPLIWVCTLLYYFHTLLSANTQVLGRVVAALHPGSVEEHAAFTRAVQHLVYRSIYVPFRLSCALACTALLVLVVFSWIAPVFYVSIAVFFVFVLSFFPLLGAAGFVIVGLPWAAAVALHGGPVHLLLALALLLVFTLALKHVQGVFLENVADDQQGLSLVAIVMGFSVFGPVGIFVGPFIAGACALIFAAFTAPPPPSAAHAPHEYRGTKVSIA